MDIKLGFTTGVIRPRETSLKEKIRIIRDAGCKVIELGFLRTHEIFSGALDSLTSDDLAGFEYVSLHAPSIEYGNNNETFEVMSLIQYFNEICPLSLVVFHPNKVKNFSIFEDLEFPVGFETMECSKGYYKAPDDFYCLLNSDLKFNLVLDFNHIYSFDPTMQIASDFYEKYGSRIKEIHLSAFQKGNHHHEAFFRMPSQQLEIIKAIQDFSTPIILESPVEAHEIKLEKGYVFGVIEAIMLNR